MVELLQLVWDSIVASGANAVVYGVVLLVVVFAAEYLGVAPTGNARRIALALSAFFLKGVFPDVLPVADGSGALAPSDNLVMVLGVLFAALIHEAPGLFAAIKAKTAK